MNPETSVSFVQRCGSPIERARLAAIIWDKAPPQDVLDELAAVQNPDGGLAFRLRPGQVSSVGNTAFALQWLDDMKVRRGPIVESACRFLLDQQQVDGGWDEAEAIRVLNPPEWREPGRIEARVWLTAYCAHVLIRHGRAEVTGTGCPARFLLAHCDDTGRLAGYLRATWIALPMFALYPGRDTEPFRQALSVVQEHYAADWDSSCVAWLLRCLSDAGLPAETALVARCLADLEKKQRPDGSWGSEDGEEHAAGATVEALRALRAYRRI
jgi:hypothetical protein